MNAIIDLFSGPAWQHLALALLHTLWQGVAAAAILWILLRRIGVDRPDARYWTAFGVLAGLLLCGLTTWAILDCRVPHSQALASRSTAAEPHRADAPPASATTATPALAEPAADELPHRSIWSAVLLAAWFLGVILMTVRMAWLVARSRRLMLGAEIEDGRLLSMVEELRRAFGIRRQLRMVEAIEGWGPAVSGAIQPVLAVPLCLLTGLPPDALRAVLAHELAHIRRHDYLLNLVQMAIESLLFFNPAVWWISRQIRIEREACCDALATQAVERPLALAEALSLCAEQVRVRIAPAAAFADEGRRRPQLLLDRVRRLLQPGYRPQASLSPKGLMMFLAATAVALVALSCGAKAVVDLAAKALTPAERMKQVAQTQRQYASPEQVTEADSPDGVATLSGTICTRNGSPPPKKTRVNRRTERRKNTTFANGGEQPPDFSVDAGAGTTCLTFESEGYAPAVAGPFHLKAGEKISGIKVLLDRGFDVPAHVVDENGKPVTGAEVRGWLLTGDNSIGSGFRRLSDSKGMVVMTHLAEGKYRFDIHKAGFQPLDGFVQPIVPRQPVTFTLTHAKPLQGVVVSADGQPVAGADIRILVKSSLVGSGKTTHSYSESGPVLAVTDSQGRFILNQLMDDASYELLISTKSGQRQLIHNVVSGRGELRVELGPELTISGTIRGDLARLTKEDGKPVIRWSESVPFPGHNFSNGIGGTVPVEPVKGGGKFTIRGLLPGEVMIHAGNVFGLTMGPSRIPHQTVDIDLTLPLAEYPKRPVVLRFATPDGTVLPEGTIQIRLSKDGENYACGNPLVSLKNGVARFDAYAPGGLSYESVGLIGYWFETVWTRVEPGKGPQTITVPVLPAGAVAGQVLDADGKPANEKVTVSVTGELKIPHGTRFGGFGDGDIKPDAKGRFFATPLPLGGKYSVKAQRGHTVQVVSPVLLDAAHPTKKLTLQLPPTTAVNGVVLDPEGQPLARIPLKLEFLSNGDSPANRQSCGWSEGLKSDVEGQFRISDLGVGVGKYSLEIEPNRDFCPAHVELPLDGKPVVLRLKRGQTLTGQLLDDATGRPIAGGQVVAYPTDHRSPSCSAEGLTDQQGKFRFSNLDDREYQFCGSNGLDPVNPTASAWRPGQTSVTVRVKIAEWSDFKPQPKP